MINHTGVVERIEGNLIFVRIVQQSACSGCHAKGMCSASESKDKVIEVPDYTGTFQVNEEVLICGQSSLGLKAVWLAFVLPLVMVVVAIALGHQLGWAETTGGFCGLVTLAAYYGILYLLREKLKRRFVFTLRKLK